MNNDGLCRATVPPSRELVFGTNMLISALLCRLRPFSITHGNFFNGAVNLWHRRLKGASVRACVRLYCSCIRGKSEREKKLAGTGLRNRILTC